MAEWERDLRDRTIYQVAPRYTPGSPAQVDQRTAERVAALEADEYRGILSAGAGSPEHRAAAAIGLHGIAEALTETRGGWHVVDLITGARFFRSQAPWSQAPDRAHVWAGRSDTPVDLPVAYARRYLNDPIFHHVVHQLAAMLENEHAGLTAADLRATVDVAVELVRQRGRRG